MTASKQYTELVTITPPSISILIVHSQLFFGTRYGFYFPFFISKQKSPRKFVRVNTRQSDDYFACLHNIHGVRIRRQEKGTLALCLMPGR